MSATDETSWTLAADALDRAIDELVAETRPHLIPDDPAEIADLHMRLQIAGHRVQSLRGELAEAYRDVAANR